MTGMRPDPNSDEAGRESEYGNDTGFAAESTRVAPGDPTGEPVGGESDGGPDGAATGGDSAAGGTGEEPAGDPADGTTTSTGPGAGAD